MTEATDDAGDRPTGAAHDGEESPSFSAESISSELTQAAELHPGSENVASTRLREVMKNAGVLLGGRTVNAVLSLTYLGISAPGARRRRSSASWC